MRRQSGRWAPHRMPLGPPSLPPLSLGRLTEGGPAASQWAPEGLHAGASQGPSLGLSFLIFEMGECFLGREMASSFMSKRGQKFPSILLPTDNYSCSWPPSPPGQPCPASLGPPFVTQSGRPASGGPFQSALKDILVSPVKNDPQLWPSFSPLLHSHVSQNG